MEAAKRWETEAIRESRDRRRARPTVSQERTTSTPDGDWQTLREVSDETGIPLGTLRKWCRRESVDSYLESDGEQTLRMLELSSVKEHAKAMGRDLSQSRQPTANSQQPEPPDDPVPTAGGEPAEAGSTMIVPVDAWNKMLTQLGNLHEAGQQLAEARERAGKAETEAKFLRERLAEMREESGQPTANSQRPEPTHVPPTAGSSSSPSGGGGNAAGVEGGGQSVPTEDTTDPTHVPPTAGSSSSPSGGGGNATGVDGGGQSVPAEDTTDPTHVPPAEGRGDAEEHSDDAGGQPSAETTSFWRYVVHGWKGRRR